MTTQPRTPDQHQPPADLSAVARSLDSLARAEAARPGASFEDRVAARSLTSLRLAAAGSGPVIARVGPGGRSTWLSRARDAAAGVTAARIAAVLALATGLFVIYAVTRPPPGRIVAGDPVADTADQLGDYLLAAATFESSLDEDLALIETEATDLAASIRGGLVVDAPDAGEESM